MKIIGISVAVALGGLSAGAMGDVLADWTFETSVPNLMNSMDSGSYAAEGGINALTSFAKGHHADAATDYSSPAGNGSARSFSSNTWDLGDYYQFTTSTVGYRDITFGWDQTRSSTGPTPFDLSFSLDGINFTTLMDDYTVALNANPPGFWNMTNSFADYTFAPIGAPVPKVLVNQPIVYFRLTSQMPTGNPAGTNRVDNVLIQGNVPAPGATALLGVAGLVAVRRRR